MKLIGRLVRAEGDFLQLVAETGERVAARIDLLETAPRVSTVGTSAFPSLEHCRFAHRR